VDPIADTVGGEIAAKLIAKVKQSGWEARLMRVRTQPDPSKVREFAEGVRDAKFVLPIELLFPNCSQRRS